jgi:hypothetical protein
VSRLLRKKPQAAVATAGRKENPRGGNQRAPVNVARGAIAVFFENHGEMTVNVKSGNGPSKE